MPQIREYAEIQDLLEFLGNPNELRNKILAEFPSQYQRLILSRQIYPTSDSQRIPAAFETSFVQRNTFTTSQQNSLTPIHHSDRDLITIVRNIRNEFQPEINTRVYIDDEQMSLAHAYVIDNNTAQRQNLSRRSRENYNAPGNILNLRSSIYGATALMLAVIKGDFEAVKDLVTIDNINIPILINGVEITPLWFAALFCRDIRYERILKFLSGMSRDFESTTVLAGARGQMDQNGPYGFTPFHLICAFGNADLIKSATKIGPDIEIRRDFRRLIWDNTATFVYALHTQLHRQNLDVDRERLPEWLTVPTDIARDIVTVGNVALAAIGDRQPTPQQRDEFSRNRILGSAGSVSPVHLAVTFGNTAGIHSLFQALEHSSSSNQNEVMTLFHLAIYSNQLSALKKLFSIRKNKIEALNLRPYNENTRQEIENETHEILKKDDAECGKTILLAAILQKNESMVMEILDAAILVDYQRKRLIKDPGPALINRHPIRNITPLAAAILTGQENIALELLCRLDQIGGENSYDSNRQCFVENIPLARWINESQFYNGRNAERLQTIRLMEFLCININQTRPIQTISESPLPENLPYPRQDIPPSPQNANYSQSQVIH